jgi:hypothetical protein
MTPGLRVIAATVLPLAALLSGALLGSCVGGGRGSVTGSIDVQPCDPDVNKRHFVMPHYSLDPNYFFADFYAPDCDPNEAYCPFDEGLSIHIQNGTDYTLRDSDGLIFNIDNDMTRKVALMVKAGGKAGATVDVSPGGTVQANFRLYGTCPILYGDFQGVGNITFTSFPAPPKKATDAFTVELGTRLTGTFELTTIDNIRDGGSIGDLTGFFDFYIERGAGSTLFP